MSKRKMIKSLLARHLPTLIKAELMRCLPFFFSKLTFKPKAASLNIADRCNLSCVMCNQWRQDRREELSTKEWNDVIRQLKEEGIEEINFTGGEPLLRDDLTELVQYASSLGITCGITTNGYLLDDNRANSLINNGLSIFTLSIDALGNSYDKIRGLKGAYERVKNAAKILSDFRKQGIASVYISFVLMKPTLEHLTEVINFCKEVKLPLVICLLDKTPYLFDLAENQENLWLTKDDYSKLENVQRLLFKEKTSNHGFIYNGFSDIDFLKDYFLNPIQKQIPCVVSQTRIFIDSAGNVFGGCWSMGNFGNLREKRLRDIVNNHNYRQLHKQMFYKRCPGCSCGFSTNLRYNLNSQFKNFIKQFCKRGEDD